MLGLDNDRFTQAKFEKTELHRRPEFSEDSKPQINRTASISRPPVPPFNPNTSTSSATSTSASTAGQPAANGARNSLPNGRPPVVNVRPSASTSNNSSTANTSAQSASNGLNQNNRPPQSHQHEPHQQQAQNRRVTFAESALGPRNNPHVPDTSAQTDMPKPEVDEDSFDFGDDDIFLAALGMEEGDLGRPIETDADMGPPLDHEESFLPPEGDTSVAVSDASTANVSANDTSRNEKAARVQRLQEIMNASTGSSNSNNPLHTTSPIQQSTPIDQMQNASNTTSSSARTVFNDSRFATTRSSNGTNNTHQANDQPTHQQRYPRPFAKPQFQNQNENPNPVFSNANESGVKRSPTPSMGGFHFPPGMVRIWVLHISFLKRQPI